MCDTSFLMHLATRRVRNADRMYLEVGDVSFVVPDVVIHELGRIAGRGGPKGYDAGRTLEFAGRLQTLEVGAPDGERDGADTGTTATAHVDDIILEYASARGSIVATMDKNLKRRLKGAGCSVVSFANDNVVLEP